MTRPTTVIEVLRAARAKIRLKRNWCREVMARGPSGREVDPVSKRACQWCAVGAVYAVAAKTGLHDSALNMLGPSSPAGVNDHEGHAAVMRLFTKAIRELEEAGR